MRWRSGRRSTNIEDRRRSGAVFRFPRSRTARRGGGISIGGIVVALVLMWIFGIDPTMLLQGQMDTPVSYEEPSRTTTIDQARDELADFVSVVLADTEDTWKVLFQEQGLRYQEPKLVLFRGAVSSACGFAQAAMGPFYCPADHKVYIDLSFYEDMKRQLGAPGDFAQAYVIAHEVGHHVQNLFGVSSKVQQLQQRMSEADGNKLSVRVELQADCYAGVWANRADKARQILEKGDIEEALNAASAIGDDRLQRQAGGYVTPDSFTHGTSKQRVRWFKTGLESGELPACDTFSVARL